ncbi:formyltransferase family protein [uncultured Desulfovibrio sp.]|uniref:formyltransferase family protein n=1 Tax=uncultured Desulfovibrio sp. TaxID=167968 RepID=UPI002631B30F|nr:formyltransferase family protein [uncultured Desulfovibrio sp.]
MRIVVFGQKWLAVEVLRELLALPRVLVAGVCPDRKGDRLEEEARLCGIPVFPMEAVPLCDLGVAACCQRYLPAVVRARCGLGILAYHPSLLPRHRGRDAIRWTLAMREPVAGGTAYWMDDGADTGPIEAQDWCHVLPGESAAELWRRKLAPLGVRLLTACVTRLAKGERPRASPQDERLATFEPAFTKTRLSD